MLVSSQALGTALDASALEASRVHARLLAREIEARGLLAADGAGPAAARDGGCARGSASSTSSTSTPREARGRGGHGPAPAAHVRDAASGEALAEAALAGREAEASVAFGAGRLARVAAPVRGADGTARGRRRGLDLPAGRRGAGGPRGAGRLHEVPQDPDLPRADPRLLPLALPVSRRCSSCSARCGSRSTSPGASRRRCASWPRAPSASPPGERGRARRLPVGQRRVPRPHRLLQPHVGAPRAQRGGGGVLARRGSCARTRSSRSAGGSRRRCSRRSAPASSSWTRRARSPR